MKGRIIDNRLCELDTCNVIFQVTSQKPNKRFCCRKCVDLFLKGKPISDVVKKKIIDFRNSETGRNIASKAGKKSSSLRTSEEYKSIGKKISQAKKGKPLFNRRGENHPNWQGGISVINKTERNLFMNTLEYKNWRREVFERDNYSCVKCNIRSSKGVKVILHADHIKPYKTFPELRLDVNNGRTLCESCHRKTETWGGKINGSFRFNRCSRNFE